MLTSNVIANVVIARTVLASNLRGSFVVASCCLLASSTYFAGNVLDSIAITSAACCRVRLVCLLVLCLQLVTWLLFVIWLLVVIWLLEVIFLLVVFNLLFFCFL